MVRSGNSFWNLSNPVGPSIAAVMATMSFLSRPISTNSFAKIDVHDAELFLTGSPVSASTIPTA